MIKAMVLMSFLFMSSTCFLTALVIVANRKKISYFFTITLILTILGIFLVHAGKELIKA